ncbi:uncharacterized protein BCR38DRAFT_499937 [Pseudomassariella vexata]|uniref:Uncharacterized protein n=1 Tax=Pseudomassariella vexata TaxID=1141098 RepID=A0A1Y2DGH1_9PEZI|nr:uncharacterized protein BCR38DRAFT_499937 [Pseudomassariella vexata]ORY58383.1 hypothetical protein BCR38DRAFT_499937 [Pseudomassariella vexata]
MQLQNWIQLWISCLAFPARGVDAQPLPRDIVDWASLRCPSDSTSKLPTPNYGSDNAVFMICTETIINASPQAVYNAVLDFKSYDVWNSFVFHVDLPANVTVTPEDVYVGMPMPLHTYGVLPLINTTSDEEMTVLDGCATDGCLLTAWRSDVVGTKAEHPSIVTDQGNGMSRYISYETYYEAILTPGVWTLKGQLQERFQQQGLDLKAYVEAL